MSKPFSLDLSQDQTKYIASSMTLYESKGFSWNIKRFLWWHIVLVRATHHPLHLLWFIFAPKPSQNWAKWFNGEAGRGPTALIHPIDSHHKFIVLLQLKKRCPTSSCTWPQSGQPASWISTFLLKRFPLVGSLSLRSLQMKTAALGVFSGSILVWKSWLVNQKHLTSTLDYKLT